MKAPIRFYFDFASPYAYFALRPFEALAKEYGRDIEYRPILLWAALKAHGIAPPLDSAVKRAYFAADMLRSAAFYGVPYKHPTNLPMSSHLAARLFYALVERRPEDAPMLTRRFFDAFFARGDDISKPEVVRGLAVAQGLDEITAHDALQGTVGRERLSAAVDVAIADNVCGSPYFLLDGEGFFGSDRLPQLAWRLRQIGKSEALQGAQ